MNKNDLRAAAGLIERLQAENAAMIAAHSAIMAAAVRAGWETDPHHPTEHIVEWLERREATAPLKTALYNQEALPHMAKVAGDREGAAMHGYAAAVLAEIVDRG